MGTVCSCFSDDVREYPWCLKLHGLVCDYEVMHQSLGKNERAHANVATEFNKGQDEKK